MQNYDALEWDAKRLQMPLTMDIYLYSSVNFQCLYVSSVEE